MPYNITSSGRAITPNLFGGEVRLRSKICIAVLSVLVIFLVTGFLLVKNAGLIVKNKLEHALGKGFSVEKIALHWGSIDASNAAFRKPDGTISLKIDRIHLSLDFLGTLRKNFSLSDLILENPYILIETGSKGQFVNPLSSEGEKSTGQVPQVSIKQFTVHNGSIDYMDGKVSNPPFLIRVRNLEFKMDNIIFPLTDSLSPFDIKAEIPGPQKTGSVNASGKINLKNKDLEGNIIIKNLDITGFKLYYQKRGEANITRGDLDINMEATVRQNIARAPGAATLRDLEFQSAGTFKDRFLGVPRSAVISILKNNRGEITFNFLIEGDLSNPHFSLRENFSEKFMMGLSEKLGISPKKITESIVREGISRGRKIFK